jgi:hypothetical protein
MRATHRGAALALLLLTSRAHATAATSFAEAPRVAGLANAVIARPGDAASMFLNPAGLGDVSEPEVVLGASYDSLSQWFARTNEPQENMGRSFGSFSVAAATPLPGPWWLERVKVGIALDTPAQYILSVNIPERMDTPSSPVYDAGPNRITMIGALGLDILPQLKLGAGVNITPSLTTPTTVTFVPGKTPIVQDDVSVSLDRSLPLSAAPFAGVRAQPLPFLGFALVYRSSAVSHVGGEQSTTAGPIVADSLVDYLIFWSPNQVAFGGAVGPFRHLSLSVDGTWSEWSSFKSSFDQAALPAFHDTVSVMAGLEWEAQRWLTVRGGGGYEPSPISSQTADSNYLGAGTTVLALGAGVDLRPLVRFPMRIDAHVRGRFGAEETATKDASSLTDADSTTRGKQIDNLGYPGFASQSTLYQVGLSLTFFVERGAR